MSDGACRSISTNARVYSCDGCRSIRTGKHQYHLLYMTIAVDLSINYSHTHIQHDFGWRWNDKPCCHSRTVLNLLESLQSIIFGFGGQFLQVSTRSMPRTSEHNHLTRL